MNLSAVDLNLLVVFDAMIEERSVTRAARRVNLSQPAISHALNRLRHLFADELFVRGPDGMRPTPRALEIAGPVRHALNEISQALDGAGFDPATSQRRFVTAAQNHASIVMLPHLVDRLRDEAPGVDFRVYPGQAPDIMDGLEKGRIDVATGSFPALPDRFASEELLVDDLVCVLRADHPLAADCLTIERYAALPHLIVSFDGAEDVVDRILAEQGLTRRVSMSVTHFLAASIVLARSDMVVTVTRRVAEAFGVNQNLRILPLPFASPQERISMVWHRRLANHPAQIWLRSMFAEAARRVRFGRE
jgi:DNA-binding transcriptional LysR family regulator